MKRILFILLSVVVLSGCAAKKTEHSGYSFDETSLKKITLNRTNREGVLKAMGSPSFKSKLAYDGSNDEVWVYYYQKTDAYLFFNPKVKERKIVAFEFDNRGHVKSILNRDLKDAQKVRFAKDTTKSKDDKGNALVDMLMNVGTFGSAESDD